MTGIIGLITGLLPLVSSIVQNIEMIFGRGNGPAKKDAATAAIADIINIAGTVSGQTINSSEIMEGIGKIIDGTVQVMNATGVFKKG